MATPSDWRSSSPRVGQRWRPFRVTKCRSLWAKAQLNLGAALWLLSEREGGTQRLIEAVAAFDAALMEWSRERGPWWWAVTQVNRGLALLSLGEREIGTAQLEVAERL